MKNIQKIVNGYLENAKFKKYLAKADRKKRWVDFTDVYLTSDQIGEAENECNHDVYEGIVLDPYSSNFTSEHKDKKILMEQIKKGFMDVQKERMKAISKVGYR